MGSFGFFLKETIDGIRQHSTGSFVTILQVFISLYFLGMSLLVITNINHIIDGFLDNLEIKAYLSDEVSIKQAAELEDKILSLQGVREVKYVSKEEAFGFMQERTAIDISDLVTKNPLPASINITAKNPKIASEIAGMVRSLEGVDDVTYGEEQLSKILPFFYGAELFSFLLAIFIAAVTMITIANTVRLAIYARRKEIQIMQLVGATGWFIRIPFVLEGFVYGMVGSGLALISEAIVYSIILNIIAAKKIFLPLIIDFNLMIVNLTIMMFVLGAFIGIIASLIAVGKHLEEDMRRPVQVRGASA